MRHEHTSLGRGEFEDFVITQSFEAGLVRTLEVR